jgi:Trypsin
LVCCAWLDRPDCPVGYFIPFSTPFLTLSLTKDTVKTIRLPRRSQQGTSFNGVEAKVSGWGTGGGSGQIYPTQHLQTITLSVITNLVCTASFPIYIDSSNICTSSFRGTPCYGDEGGPMTITESDGGETLVGVTSFTASWGCSSVWPAVYSRLTSYLDWIEANSDVVIQN